MADLVSMTLGPNGRSVIMERGQEPFIIDDGRRVAENILLDDPVEQAAVRIAYGVTQKTDEEAGDGTTTAMVLTRAILSDVSHERMVTGIGTQVDIAGIETAIEEAKNEVTKLLEKEAKPIKTEKELINVASVIAGNEEIGKLIGEIYWKLGKDGHITIEMNPLSENMESEIVAGYRFPGGYAAPWMKNNAITKTFNASDIDILVTSQEITDINGILQAANMVAEEGKQVLVVVGKDFGESVIQQAYANATRKVQPFYVICIKPRNQELYKDMAVFTNAKLFTPNDPLTPTKEDLGYMKSIEVGAENSIFISGRGKKASVDIHIKELESEAKGLKLEGYRQPIYERISALQGGVGVIRIGAPTEEARTWLKYKVEDTKFGTKYAFKEGVVQGGGLTFKKISDALPDTNILKKALLAPHETLLKNAGGKMTVGKNVVDALVAEKAALKYACSAVSKLLRIGGAIVHVPTPTLDEAFRLNKSQD